MTYTEGFMKKGKEKGIKKEVKYILNVNVDVKCVIEMLTAVQDFTYGLQPYFQLKSFVATLVTFCVCLGCFHCR